MFLIDWKELWVSCIFFQAHLSERICVMLILQMSPIPCANIVSFILSRQWAELEALATVLSMAFDPAYQALIRIEQRPVYQNHPIALGRRALSFEDSLNSEYWNYVVPCKFLQHAPSFSSFKHLHRNTNDSLFHFLRYQGGRNGYFSSDWNHAISNAILSETSNVETDPSCPTGNCTFPVFSSLAFCSDCIDIKESLQQSLNCTKKNSTGEERYDHGVTCSYWFPNSASSPFHIVHDSPDDSRPLDDKDREDFTWYYINGRENEPPTYIETPSLIIRFLFISSGGAVQMKLPSGKIIPSFFAAIALVKFAPVTGFASPGSLSTAHICALSVCAREYNIWMTSGSTHSEVVSTSYGKRNTLENPNYRRSLSYSFTFPNDFNSFTFIANTTDSYFDDGLVTYSTLTFEQVTSDSLKDILSFDINDFPNETVSGLSLRLSLTTHMFPIALNASTNIPRTMDRVAAAMSNRLRDISNLTVQGQSGSMEMYIRVSWLWLLLPGFSVILGTFLLVSVMITTRKHKLPIWKTSELALLFHGFDFPLGDTVESDKVSEMEDVALALQVGLGRNSNGVLKLERKSK